MLVDTSVWIDHFRKGDSTLSRLLEEAAVECHPFVIGEIACGTLRQRVEVLALLQVLPQVPIADHDEVLAFLDRYRLAGAGMGWIDVHLLAAAQLGRTTFWTRDRRLACVARTLGIAADAP